MATAGLGRQIVCLFGDGRGRRISQHHHSHLCSRKKYLFWFVVLRYDTPNSFLRHSEPLNFESPFRRKKTSTALFIANRELGNLHFRDIKSFHLIVVGTAGKGQK